MAVDTPALKLQPDAPHPNRQIPYPARPLIVAPMTTPPAAGADGCFFRRRSTITRAYRSPNTPSSFEHTTNPGTAIRSRTFIAVFMASRYHGSNIDTTSQMRPYPSEPRQMGIVFTSPCSRDPLRSAQTPFLFPRPRPAEGTHLIRACSLVNRSRRRSRQPTLPLSGRRERRRERMTISFGLPFISPLANYCIWLSAPLRAFHTEPCSRCIGSSVAEGSTEDRVGQFCGATGRGHVHDCDIHGLR